MRNMCANAEEIQLAPSRPSDLMVEMGVPVMTDDECFQAEEFPPPVIVSSPTKCCACPSPSSPPPIETNSDGVARRRLVRFLAALFASNIFLCEMSGLAIEHLFIERASEQIGVDLTKGWGGNAVAVITSVFFVVDVMFLRCVVHQLLIFRRCSECRSIKVESCWEEGSSEIGREEGSEEGRADHEEVTEDVRVLSVEIDKMCLLGTYLGIALHMSVSFLWSEMLPPTAGTDMQKEFIRYFCQVFIIFMACKLLSNL